MQIQRRNVTVFFEGMKKKNNFSFKLSYFINVYGPNGIINSKFKVIIEKFVTHVAIGKVQLQPFNGFNKL